MTNKQALLMIISDAIDVGSDYIALLIRNSEDKENIVVHKRENFIGLLKSISGTNVYDDDLVCGESKIISAVAFDEEFSFQQIEYTLKENSFLEGSNE